jgi:dihydrofolate reductase
MTKIKLIAAISRYRGIGKDNRLPWNCKRDLKFFYDNTVSTLKKREKIIHTQMPFLWVQIHLLVYLSY